MISSLKQFICSNLVILTKLLQMVSSPIDNVNIFSITLIFLDVFTILEVFLLVVFTLMWVVVQKNSNVIKNHTAVFILSSIHLINSSYQVTPKLRN